LVSWLEKIHFDSQKSKFEITSTTELKKDYCEYFLNSAINGSNSLSTFWKILNIFLQRKFPHFSFGETFTTKIKDVWWETFPWKICTCGGISPSIFSNFLCGKAKKNKIYHQKLIQRWYIYEWKLLSREAYNNKLEDLPLFNSTERNLVTLCLVHTQLSSHIVVQSINFPCSEMHYKGTFQHSPRTLCYQLFRAKISAMLPFVTKMLGQMLSITKTNPTPLWELRKSKNWSINQSSQNEETSRASIWRRFAERNFFWSNRESLITKIIKITTNNHSLSSCFPLLEQCYERSSTICWEKATVEVTKMTGKNGSNNTNWKQFESIMIPSKWKLFLKDLSKSHHFFEKDEWKRIKQIGGSWWRQKHSYIIFKDSPLLVQLSEIHI